MSPRVAALPAARGSGWPSSIDFSRPVAPAEVTRRAVNRRMARWTRRLRTMARTTTTRMRSGAVSRKSIISASSTLLVADKTVRHTMPVPSGQPRGSGAGTCVATTGAEPYRGAPDPVQVS